jgi:hypothetical protein
LGENGCGNALRARSGQNYCQQKIFIHFQKIDIARTPHDALKLKGIKLRPRLTTLAGKTTMN